MLAGPLRVNLALVGAIEVIVFRLPAGHPNQVPYIVVWRDLVKVPTSWIKLFLPSGLPSHSCEPETANQLIALPFVLAAQEREGAGKEQQVDWSSQTP